MKGRTGLKLFKNRCGLVAAAVVSGARDRGIPRRTAETFISNQVFGTLVFVFTEVMFFIGLISAYLVIRGDGTSWAVPAGIRLPVVATAYNSCVLLASGVLLVLARKAFESERRELSVQLLGWAAVLGVGFVAFQGFEWLQLISFGMTMTSGIFAACFFLLIGVHGVHALTGALAIAYYYFRAGGDFLGLRSWLAPNFRLQTAANLGDAKLQLERLKALQLFWLFIVGVWPILYLLVYF